MSRPTVALFLLLTFFLFPSCTSDRPAGQGPVTVCLTLKVADSPVTRSLSSTNENTIRDITVLIFDSSSQLIGSKYVDGLSSATGVTATVTTRAASGCTVYAISNTGSASFFSGVNTIVELNEKCATLSGATALGDASGAVMEGRTPDVTISTGTNNINVAMKHLCSKVNVSIVPSGDITVTGYQLCNAALGSYITDSHTSSGTAVTSPANDSGKSYGDFDAVTLSSPSAGTKVTIPAYYVYENLAGSSNSTLTTDQERTSARAPSNAMYLLIYAKTSSWHSVYRIYLGGMTDAADPTTEYSNFNVYRNKNYSYTVNINGSGQGDARVSYTADSTTPVIGQYLYSDGTWGSYDPARTVIGIVFSNTTSSTDRSHGWTHGYAMALQNAGSSSATYQWYNSNNGNLTGTYITGVNNIMSDKDGYTHSGYLQTSGYAAGIAAKGYSAKDKNGNTIAAPIGTSGWYLPSCGQWYDILASLGGMVAASGKAYTFCSTCYLRWYGPDTSGDTHNYSSLCASNLNVYLNSLKSNGYSVDLFSNNSERYWSSSEYFSSSAYYVYFYSNGYMSLYYNSKKSSFRVRPVVAF
jgi:uncharacterized protein (TIGR02145 family)